MAGQDKLIIQAEVTTNISKALNNFKKIEDSLRRLADIGEKLQIGSGFSESINKIRTSIGKLGESVGTINQQFETTFSKAGKIIQERTKYTTLTSKEITPAMREAGYTEDTKIAIGKRQVFRKENFDEAVKGLRAIEAELSKVITLAQQASEYMSKIAISGYGTGTPTTKPKRDLAIANIKEEADASRRNAEKVREIEKKSELAYKDDVIAMSRLDAERHQAKIAMAKEEERYQAKIIKGEIGTDASNLAEFKRLGAERIADTRKNYDTLKKFHDTSRKLGSEGFLNLFPADTQQKIRQSYTNIKQFQNDYLNDTKAKMSSMKAILDGHKKGFAAMTNSILGDTWRLIEWQARWYGAKMALFAIAGAPVAMGKEAFNFAKMLDDWNVKLLRWEATSGKVTDAVRADMANVIKQARELALKYPITVDEILKSTEQFVAAGMPSSVIKQLIPTFAKMRTVFPEINMEQFAPAIVGAWNAWKTTIGGTADEAQRFTIILEKLLAAQAKGVIRPEQFTVLLQHLSEMARVSGFTLDQMLALGVATTDLGSKTGSAARSLRQMIIQLQSTKNLDNIIKWMSGAGVVVDPKKSLGEQFFNVMRGFQKLVGTGGERSMEAMKFLSKIFPTETMKSASTAIDYLDKIVELAEKTLPGAFGALDTSSKLMLDSMGNRMKLLKNQYIELSASIFGDNLTGPWRNFAAFLNDIMYGALLAFGSRIAEAVVKVENLGDAGKATYGSLKALTDIFGIMGLGISTILKPIAGIFGIFGKVLGSASDGVTLFSRAITTLLITALISKMKFLSLSIGSLTGITTALKVAGTAAGAFSKILAFLGGLKVIGIVVMFEIISMIKDWKEKDLRDLKESLSVERLMRRGATPEEKLDVVEQSIKRLEEDKAILQRKLWAEKELSKKAGILDTVFPQRGSTLFDKWQKGIATGKTIETLDESLSQFKTKREELKKEVADKEKLKTTGIVPDTDKQKNAMTSLINAARGLRNEEIGLEKAKLQEKQALLDDAHKIALISEKDYFNQSIENMRKSYSDELNLAIDYENEIKDETGAIYKEYLKKRAEATEKKQSKEYIQAIDDEYRRRVIEAEKKTQEIKTTMMGAELTKTREHLENVRNLEIKHIEDILQLKLMAIELESSRINDALKIRNSWNEFWYGKNRISSKKYYGDMVEMYNTEFIREMLEADTKLEKDRETLRGQFRIEQYNEFEMPLEKQREYNDAIAKLYASDAKTRQDIANKLATNMVSTQQKMMEDLHKVYDEAGGGIKGIMATMGKRMVQVADDLTATWKNAGAVIDDVAQAMQNSLEAFFDYTSDKFLDWKNLITSIASEIYKTLVKNMIIKQFVGGLMGVIGTSLGVKFPGMQSGGEVALNRAYVVGERGPELFVPNANGMIIPNGAFGNAPNVGVVVNVNNKSDAKVKTSAGNLSFNGKEWVKNIMIDLSNSDPTIRGRYGVR